MERKESGCLVIDDEFNVVFANESARAQYPYLTPGHKCYAGLTGSEPCPSCPALTGVVGPHQFVNPTRGVREYVDMIDLNIRDNHHWRMLIFNAIDENNVLSSLLPANSGDIDRLSLIRALTGDSYDVFSVNLRSGEMIMYRHNRKPVTRDALPAHIRSYHEGITHYANKYVHPEDRDLFLSRGALSYITECLKQNEFMTVHYRIVLHGETHHFVRKIARMGDAENFTGFVVGVSCEDEEVRRREETLVLRQQLKELELDSMTGLYTKEALFIRAEALKNRFPDSNLDFCILKLENLGLINHQYGHAAGDELIRLIGRHLKQKQLDDNCIAYVNDGIYIMITVATPDGNRVRNIENFNLEVRDDSPVPGLSLKWCVWKDIPHTMSVDSVYEKTRFALTTIFALNHSDYIEFDHTTIDRMEWDQTVEKEFNSAIRDNEFILEFQPKYSALTGELVGAEALVRWLRGGIVVPPKDFIPVLEANGKIAVLDRYIFRKTCALQSMIKERGLRQIPISVNLSRSSIFFSDISNEYAADAAEYGIDPKLVPIEITETASVKTIALRDFANSLVAKSFQLDLDDFGAGFSSMSILNIVPFNTIKIDKTLVDFIDSESGRSLLRHTIAFAKELGKNVIAEGVETYNQFIFLKESGCDAIQGYYFSKPLSEENFLKLLKP